MRAFMRAALMCLLVPPASQDKKFTEGIVAETHGFYTALRSGARANDKELSLF
jgi:hypothetical protein